MDVKFGILKKIKMQKYKIELDPTEVKFECFVWIKWKYKFYQGSREESEDTTNVWLTLLKVKKALTWGYHRMQIGKYYDMKGEALDRREWLKLKRNLID